jgi:hypothetical protein
MEGLGQRPVGGPARRLGAVVGDQAGDLGEAAVPPAAIGVEFAQAVEAVQAVRQLARPIRHRDGDEDAMPRVVSGLAGDGGLQVPVGGLVAGQGLGVEGVGRGGRQGRQRHRRER